MVFAQETVEDENKPMIAPTDKGSIDVELSWSPIPLEPEQTTQLHIRFLQKDKVTLQQHIDYKIFVENDGIEVFRIPLTHTNPGEVTIPYAFTSTGSFLIGVDVEGILFQPISKETATFSVVVVPEFPISVMFIMTIVIAATIISIRMKPYTKSIYKN
ncbi:MAG: hypothetical protein EX285_02510 [Thaumarchaeota archaeon]|nr:hypothetical protein [Nitrososphaerota archaeon]